VEGHLLRTLELGFAASAALAIGVLGEVGAQVPPTTRSAQQAPHHPQAPTTVVPAHRLTNSTLQQLAQHRALLAPPATTTVRAARIVAGVLGGRATLSQLSPRGHGVIEARTAMTIHGNLVAQIVLVVGLITVGEEPTPATNDNFRHTQCLNAWNKVTVTKGVLK